MTIADQLERNLRTWVEANLLIANDLIVQDTRDHMSRRTGHMADTVEIDQWANEGTRYSTTARVTAEYARYQDEGTGEFGPEGTRIVPTKPGGVLAFDWPAAGGFVFFKSVAGSPGTHFFTDAMPDRFRAAMLAAFA